ncbi:GuaB3 family IMP dehydrogenase-related protein [Candidatus Margulisiibacteriota bacterium]
MNSLEIGRGKKTKRAYGFDEISLSPGTRTIDSKLCDTSIELANLKLDVPIFLSAMDSVVNPQMAVLMGELGGAGVFNLHGIQTRYDNTDDIYTKISSVKKDEYVELMQKIYSEPVKEELVAKRIKEIKNGGGPTIVSSIPQDADRFLKIAEENGADVFVVQSTVVSTNHIKEDQDTVLNIEKFCSESKIPIIIGNCATYDVAMQYCEAGASAILVGIGPGAACTSRGVLGIGVPMATSIADAAGARDDYFAKTNKYISIIADGGMVSSGDICKAIACGADAVMIGSPFAKAKEAPGHGYHWGMATPNATLPRGSRIYVGTIGTLEEIIHGPARYDDGSQNFIGALKTSMGTLGARTIKEMRQVDIIVAPSILSEGKVYQKAQSLGMYHK